MLLNNYPLLFVICLLFIAIFLFISNRIRMDVVALLIIVVFSLSGILTTKEVLAGFSDPNVILIALLFIVGEGLLRTGVAYQVSDWLLKTANNSELKVLILLMCAVCGLGAFMSSTGIVAIFIPVVLAICRSMDISPKRLMMPLSIAGLTSGMMTLIATPPNLIANSELVNAGHNELGFFDFTPIGIMVLGLSIIYLYFARRLLASDTNKMIGDNEIKQRYKLNDFVTEYQLDGRAKQVIVMPNSPMIGKTLDELHLYSQYGILIIAIERWRKIRKTFISASATTEIREKDVILCDLSDQSIDWQEFCEKNSLKEVTIRGSYLQAQQAKSVGMAEISPVPNNSFLGKTVREIRFQEVYGLIIIGVKREGKRLNVEPGDINITVGDQYLVVGRWDQIRELQSDNRTFFVLNSPVEIEQVAPALTQAPYAILSVMTMVVLMVSGIVPNVIAALIACLMLAKFRCIDAKSAYSCIHWPSLILIVGMMPFAIALDKTGGITLAVNRLLDLVGDLDIHIILASLFILCAIVSSFISNTATAILMAPIAVAMANALDVSPVPFAVTIAIAASAAFMTPVASPVNTMVLGPGGYKFSDFLKVGIPFTVIVMVATVVVVPILFG